MKMRDTQNTLFIRMLGRILGGFRLELRFRLAMTIDEAYRLVANLDYKESLRRIAPQHGLLQFNRQGEVESVYRYKAVPREKEQHEALESHPGCLQISTMPDWFSSPEELQDRINQDLWLFDHMKK